MVSKIRSMGIKGIKGYEVGVECFLSSGLPNFDIVGLGDTAVKEARDRVRAAVKNTGMFFPASHVTINLAPANTKKVGTTYDLPILLSILVANGDIKPIGNDCAFIGELSLSGELRPVRGALSMAIAAAKFGIKKLYVPFENANEASFAQGIEIYGLKNLKALLRALEGEQISPTVPPKIKESTGFSADFSEVKGQQNAKRALEVAAAGGHNVLLVGPAGTGKSMLAKRIPSILPDMSKMEALEATEIHSVMGYTSDKNPLIVKRPFRSPHHTLSSSAMAGGAGLLPGEISLAHNGVLFLDELPEFHRDVLEVMRQPLEDGSVTISRSTGSVTYPASFMLICAMNPCKCGWYGHPSNKCTCTEAAVRKYHSKLSGPLLDRIDIIIEVPSLDYSQVRDTSYAESSSEIKKRVDAARNIQRQRFVEFNIDCNARMGQRELREACKLSESCETLLEMAFDKMNLSARSYDRILRVARTIADLDSKEEIEATHIAEAIQYRTYNFRGADS